MIFISGYRNTIMSSENITSLRQPLITLDILSPSQRAEHSTFTLMEQHFLLLMCLPHSFKAIKTILRVEHMAYQ